MKDIFIVVRNHHDYEDSFKELIIAFEIEEFAIKLVKTFNAIEIEDNKNSYEYKKIALCQ